MQEKEGNPRKYVSLTIMQVMFSHLIKYVKFLCSQELATIGIGCAISGYVTWYVF